MVKVAPDASGQKHDHFRCMDVQLMSNAEYADWFLHAVDRMDDARAPRLSLYELSKTLASVAVSLGQDQDDHRYTDSTQRFLNKLHTANLLLQGQTEFFKLLVAADNDGTSAGELGSPEKIEGWDVHLPTTPSKAKVMWNKIRKRFRKGDDVWDHMLDDGQKKRRDLLERSLDPDFMLEFGPIGDLPIHVAFLLGKVKLGCQMLEQVQSSDAFWIKCETLIAQHGDKNMPFLPEPKDRNTESLQEFILNIPYQHDLSWWLREWDRREKEMAEGWSEMVSS